MQTTKTYRGYTLDYDTETAVGKITHDQRVLISNLQADNATQLIKLFHTIVAQDIGGEFKADDYKEYIVQPKHAVVDARQEFSLVKKDLSLPNPKLGDILCNANADLIIPEDCQIVYNLSRSDGIGIYVFQNDAFGDSCLVKSVMDRKDLASKVVVGNVYSDLMKIGELVNGFRRVQDIITKKLEFYIDQHTKSDFDNLDDIIDYLSNPQQEPINPVVRDSWISTIKKVTACLEEE